MKVTLQAIKANKYFYKYFHLYTWRFMSSNYTNNSFKSSANLYNKWKYLYSVECQEISERQPNFTI